MNFERPLSLQFYPLDYELIHTNQVQDLVLQDRVQSHPDKFRRLPFHDYDLICSDHSGASRIELPSQLQRNSVKWYHIMAGHIGSSKLLATITSHFHFPGISAFVDDYCRTCRPCQENKSLRGYGHLPAKDAESVPWTE
ncbi:MAG: integrase zinc binding domain-containing protein, partial [bacterium]